MLEDVKVAPSILSADFNELGDAMDAIRDAGADWAHVDVMDGHFVPNITLGVPYVAAAAAHPGCLPLDVHLMVDNPLVQLPWFLECSPHVATVHVEALHGADEARKAVSLVHGAGALVGVAVNPETPASALAPTIGLWDMVLVMSVHPGFSGQSYIKGSDEKVAQVVRMARASGTRPLVEVDGGMGPDTAGPVCAAGADVVVSGSTVFKAHDMAAAVEGLREAARAAKAGKASAGR